MGKIDFNTLSPAEKQALKQQLEAEEQAEKDAIKKQRTDYQDLKDEQVKATFAKLQGLSLNLEQEKVDIFNQFGSLIAMKKELYNISDDRMDLQQSHTFTTTGGDKSIILGSNVIDGWTDDVSVGIDGINQWIESGFIDEKSRIIIRALLKPDKSGTLKANRVLDLSQKANELGDKELIKHVDFIRDQYRPVKTSTFVKAKWRNEKNEWQWLALSMSAV